MIIAGKEFYIYFKVDYIEDFDEIEKIKVIVLDGGHDIHKTQEDLIFDKEHQTILIGLSEEETDHLGSSILRAMIRIFLTTGEVLDSDYKKFTVFKNLFHTKKDAYDELELMKKYRGTPSTHHCLFHHAEKGGVK